MKLLSRVELADNNVWMFFSQDIRKAIFDDIIAKTKEGQLASFEKVC